MLSVANFLGVFKRRLTGKQLIADEAFANAPSHNQRMASRSGNANPAERTVQTHRPQERCAPVGCLGRNGSKPNATNWDVPCRTIQYLLKGQTEASKDRQMLLAQRNAGLPPARRARPGASHGPSGRSAVRWVWYRAKGLSAGTDRPDALTGVKT